MPTTFRSRRSSCIVYRCWVTYSYMLPGLMFAFTHESGFCLALRTASGRGNFPQPPTNMTGNSWPPAGEYNDRRCTYNVGINTGMKY